MKREEIEEILEHRKTFYEIIQEGSFNGGIEFLTEEEALNYLKRALNDESNCNYCINHNHTYTLYKAVYREDIDDYMYYEILPPISIKEYRNMSFYEKNLYFSGN